MTKLLVIVGTGPGIGFSTAIQFASKGFNLALLSRNADRLNDEAKRVKEAAGNVKVQTFPVDVSDHVALKKVLEDVEKQMGKPEVVVFNAARIAPTSIGETSVEDILGDFKLMNIGQYVAASWALPLLTEVAKQSGTHPSFLLNSSSIGTKPVSPMFSLSMQKAAQNNFLDSMAQVAGPKGVHIGRININGQVKDEDPVRNANSIAATLYELYSQDKKDWQSSVECGDIDELLKLVLGGS